MRADTAKPCESFCPSFLTSMFMTMGFVVDDTVDQAGFIQVVQGLFDGVGAGSPVYIVGGSVKARRSF